MASEGRRLGRPPGSGEGRDKKMSVMVTAEVLEQVQQAAKEDGLPESTWVFRALQDVLARRTKRRKPKPGSDT